MNPKKLVLGLFAAVATLFVAAPAFAQETAADIARAGASGWYALAAGLGIGIAALGGALGQGRAAASALDGIARNPSAADKMFTPLILGLALIESLVIYALIISFILSGKF
jgi:F-type H+-transporting ATPase subunit c